MVIDDTVLRVIVEEVLRELVGPEKKDIQYMCWGIGIDRTRRK